MTKTNDSHERIRCKRYRCRLATWPAKQGAKGRRKRLKIRPLPHQPMGKEPQFGELHCGGVDEAFLGEFSPNIEADHLAPLIDAVRDSA
jgi:hypothetical protein